MSMKRMWAAQVLPAPLSLMLLSLMFLSLVLLPGCGAGREAAGDAVDVPSVPVEVTEAYRGSVEVVNGFTGVVEPEMTVNVVHKTGGKVAEVRVKDGDDVQAGELLIRLDDVELSAQVAQAEAARRLAEAQLESAAKTLEDMQALYREEIVSQQQLEQAETGYKVAEAQTAQAEAALQLVRTHLNDTLITAPISGKVSGVTINPGEMAAPGIPLAVINKLETMQVGVDLTEKDVGRINEGQKVEVLVSALSSEPLEGEVQSVSPVADPRTKTYRMEVILPNEDGLLKGGMTADVRVAVAVEENTVVIPVEAVLTRQGEQIVFVVEEGLACLRQVTLGLESGEAASVLEGVEPGEQVVSSGQHYLQDGGKVTVAGGGADR